MPQEAGATNVEFLKGHIEAIPLPADSIDVVISNCVINLAGRQAGSVSRDREGAEARWANGRERHRGGGFPDRGRAGGSGALRGCIAGALSFGEYEAVLAPASKPSRRLTRTWGAAAPSRRHRACHGHAPAPAAAAGAELPRNAAACRRGTRIVAGLDRPGSGKIRARIGQCAQGPVPPPSRTHRSAPAHARVGTSPRALRKSTPPHPRHPEPAERSASRRNPEHEIHVHDHRPLRPLLCHPGVGWPTGFEPVTFGATIRCSAS